MVPMLRTKELKQSDSAGLDLLFRPRSVALIGISGNPDKLTGAPLRNLLKWAFKGKIFPVNPNYPKIGDITCYPSVEDLPEAADVALIMVAAEQVPGTIRACGKKGIPTAVVLTSGFEESAEGIHLASELRAAAAEYGMTLIGPNCEGVWSIAERAVLSFGSAANRTELFHAPIGIISQSGAVGGSVSRLLQQSEFGCAYMVSVGNETCLDVLDIMAWMIEQPDVKVILLFIEGLRNGSRLLDLARRAREKNIQIVALKSGNSKLGQEAVASHTGKIASPHAIYRDVFAQAGIIQVNGIAELIEAGELLTSVPQPKRMRGEHPGVVVFSIPGGTRALTVDLCDRYGVPVAGFEAETESNLRQVLPTFAHVGNPTDLTGQVLSNPAMFDQALAIVAEDANCEALIIQFANRGPHDLAAKLDRISAIADSKGVPVIVCFLGDELPVETRRELLKRKMISAKDPSDAVRYLSWLYAARSHLSKVTGMRQSVATNTIRFASNWEEIVQLMGLLSLPLPRSVVLRRADEVKTAVAKLIFPLVAKAFPDQAEHKTELGLVKLNLRSIEALERAVGEIRSGLNDAEAPVLVQEMVNGVEAVVSVIRDPDFGPVLAIGSGGVGIELWGDIGYLAAPVDEASIRSVIERLRLGTLLRGFRGQPAADIDALVKAAKRLSDYVDAADGGIDEIEINPLFVRAAGKGVIAADVLLKRN